MFESDKKSSLDRLKKGLYSRRDVFGDASRHEIHGAESQVPNTWEKPTEEAQAHEVTLKKTRKVYSYLFMAALGFFVIAALIGGYTLFGGKNFISTQNVDIIIEGPASIGGGETLSLDVTIANRNSTDIELVDLIAEYPSGTKDPLDPAKDLNKVRVSVGDIGAKNSAKKEISSLVFGEEGAEREIKLTAEYRTADSNAIFYKEKTYRVTISSSPVLVTIEALGKILGGQSTDINVVVISNATVPIKNLLLSLDYPFGFSVSAANPQPSYGNNIWRIGDLAPGARRSIAIKAVAEGQNDEERTIRASVGIQSEDNEREIATTIISRAHTFAIERPFLGLDLALDGERSDLAAEPGRSVRGEIIWTNNTTSKITNARIEAKLSGNVLDKNSVNATDGYYDSLSNTIVWESGRTPGLDTIAPGEDGRVGFTFATLESIPGQSASNPIITVTVSGKGSRIDDTGVSGEVGAAATRSVKLVSNLALSARALRTQGAISNTGPIPPKVDEVTTYTVVWTVTNTSNNITGAKVTANLPAYVSWTGAVSPADANITYNPTGGGIVWNVGSVPRNASVGSGAKQVSFQVALRPSANQIGTVPDIVSATTITGTDVFTGVNIQNGTPALSTRTSSDLLFKNGDETVVK
jgi:hypothetical protein